MKFCLLFICGLVLVSISGCSLFPKERVVVQKELIFIKIVCRTISETIGIVTRPIRPKAIEDKAGIFWVGLSPTDYANLAINTKETIRYIKDQKNVVKYYQDCMIDFNIEIERQQDEQTQETSTPETEEDGD